ncbi:alpha-L-fucosidase [uncultured Sunxiuqinia sp.]|uniref:alpha-L-fucosidase n=1 Tax=uncultured Sunxiuqinia sp. TaxID=1573825 RepID=UPI00262690B7|nr:alpha-L-fucosidase [uncultured Sunxiuqinia sp.]
MIRFFLFGVFLLSPIFFVFGQSLPKPTDVQYKWQEQERLMFLHFAPTTWSEVEQNDNSVSLDRINPTKLNTDQWCEAALAFGAKQIIFVAKHSGGFCWWQTETTNYGIKDTPYKNGRGDVLKEIAESCKKYGLNLGVYIYPGDRTWGAMIGSGGKTKDPAKQEAYNKVFRTQLTEVLSNYGEMLEVWFDGSCVIDVSDIMEQYAANSVVFQGPHATLRWPGTESGKLFYPAWNTVRSEDLKTGVSTQIHGTPNGDVWAPLETNTTLYDHYWFWSPEKVKKRKTVDELMDCYYKSVGYGSVFLLNASPDTTGLIVEGDMKRYKEFGDEINRRFSNPIAEINSQKGNELVLQLDKPTRINHAVVMEDYREGERIREYRIEGYSDGKWLELTKGISVGRKKIDYFDDVEVERLRLVVTKAAAEPLIRSFSVYHVSNFIPPKKQSMHVWSNPQTVVSWKKTDVNNNKLELKINLGDKINVPGQYVLTVLPEMKQNVRVENAAMFYDGNKAMQEFVQIKDNKIQINQTAQITGEADLYVEFIIHIEQACNGVVEFKPLQIN